MKKQEWISVKKGFPKKEDEYLVAIRCGNDYCIALAHFAFERENCCFDSTGPGFYYFDAWYQDNSGYGDDLEYWMNKPEKPKRYENIKKDQYIVFKTETGKELAAYTAAHTFPGEAESTRALLAYENGLQPDEIKMETVYR